MSEKEITIGSEQPIGKSVSFWYLSKKTVTDTETLNTLEGYFLEGYEATIINDKAFARVFLSVGSNRAFIHDHSYGRETTTELDFSDTRVNFSQIVKKKRITRKEALELYAKGCDLYLDAFSTKGNLRIDLNLPSKHDMRKALGIEK